MNPSSASIVFFSFFSFFSFFFNSFSCVWACLFVEQRWFYSVAVKIWNPWEESELCSPKWSFHASSSLLNTQTLCEKIKCYASVVTLSQVCIVQILLFYFSLCQNLCIKTNPQWREKFEFNRFEDGQPDVLLVELYCKKGRKCEECWGMWVQNTWPLVLQFILLKAVTRAPLCQVSFAKNSIVAQDIVAQDL